jgi:hypothetical protein
MLLDRTISFTEGKLNFGNYQAPRAPVPVAADPNGTTHRGTPLPVRQI